MVNGDFFLLAGFYGDNGSSTTSFCCLRDREDGRTSRRFGIEDAKTSEYKAKTPFEVTVFTGDKPKAGTGHYLLSFQNCCLVISIWREVFSLSHLPGFG